MEEYIREIKQIATKYTENRYDGYSQIMRICDAMREQYEKAQAEIEQWKEEANKYQKLWCIAIDDIEIAKSEAYREFAERLKLHSYIMSDKSQTGIINMYSVVTVNQIDNLLKEMVGEENDIQRSDKHD